MPQTSAALIDRAGSDYSSPARSLPPEKIAELEELKASARRLALRCALFKGSVASKAWTQVATTAIPFVLIIAAMFATVNTAYWITLLLAIPAGGLLVRFFIIQHDCGHGSFFSSRAANDAMGRAMSVLTLAPYGLWRREHAQHHATSGNLEKRGVGDITTLTVKEYMALSPRARLVYRIYRHPLFLFGLGVPIYFLVIQRLPWFHPYPARETWKSVMGLNLALAAVYGPIIYFTGALSFIMVVLPMVHVATAAGGWLFFVQHQFEKTQWDESQDWSFQLAALYGSSYYELHPVLNWFTGNIGLHHIHHLNSMIPNYRLVDCMKANPELAEINRLTLWESFKCANLKLWDDEKRLLIPFEALESREAQRV